jgi:hypothetical protein
VLNPRAHAFPEDPACAQPNPQKNFVSVVLKAPGNPQSEIYLLQSKYVFAPLRKIF